MEKKTREGVGAWMERLRQALFNAVTEEDVTAIARSLVERAKGGDLAATRLLFGYALGGVSVRNAVIVQAGQAPDMAADLRPHPLPPPTEARPRTPEKLLVLEGRATNGTALFHQDDGPQVDLS